jgi:hypothetical protein
LDEIGASFAISGVLGEHNKNQKSEILYKLIDDGFNYRILNCNYNKVAKIKNKKSEEVLIFNSDSPNQLVFGLALVLVLSDLSTIGTD